MSIAFFDVDGTLVRGSTGVEAAVFLLRRGLVSYRHLILAGYYTVLYSVGVVPYRKMYEEGARTLAGMETAKAHDLSLKCFAERILPRIYCDAIDEIYQQRLRGNKIVLISAGPKFLIEDLGRYLDAYTTIASGLIIREGLLTDEIEEPICCSEGKLALARKFAFHEGVSIHDCTFYSDSISDLPLLTAVGKPIIVNPDIRLELLAGRRGWPLLRFRDTMGISAAWSHMQAENQVKKRTERQDE